MESTCAKAARRTWWNWHLETKCYPSVWFASLDWTVLSFVVGGVDGRSSYNWVLPKASPTLSSRRIYIPNFWLRSNRVYQRFGIKSIVEGKSFIWGHLLCSKDDCYGNAVSIKIWDVQNWPGMLTKVNKFKTMNHSV